MQLRASPLSRRLARSPGDVAKAGASNYLTLVYTHGRVLPE